MGENGAHRIPDLSGGRDLGPQQVALTDVRFVASINVGVVSEVGGVNLGSPCLRVIDLSTGKAMLTPVRAAWLRQMAGEFDKWAGILDAAQGVGSRDSHSTQGD